MDFFQEASIWLAVRGDGRCDIGSAGRDRLGRVTGGSFTIFGARLEQLRPRLVALELKYEAEALTARESRELVDLRKTFDEYGSLVESLVLTANDHYLRGADVARKIIRDYPEAYQGYRVLADFYRITQDWTKFDEMVAKDRSAKSR